jgi:hypothetical protein
MMGNTEKRIGSLSMENISEEAKERSHWDGASKSPSID